MKHFKDISFWCIVLGVVVIIVVHHILSHKSDIIEGQEDQASVSIEAVFKKDSVPAKGGNNISSGLAVAVVGDPVPAVGADGTLPTNDVNFGENDISSNLAVAVVGDSVPAVGDSVPAEGDSVPGEGGAAADFDGLLPFLTPKADGTLPTVCPDTPEGTNSDSSNANDRSTNHVHGYFNASCNGDGEENDYCRFVEDGEPGSNRMWLSCRSPLEKNAEGEPLCVSPTPLPGKATTGYTWWSDELPNNITESINNNMKEKQDELRQWFANNCQRGNKCQMTEDYPSSPDLGHGGPGDGTLGHSNYIRGFFNASCNENNQANDYCRFVGYPNEDGNQGGSDRGMYLSCISSMSPRRGRGGEGGCNNKFPGPDEKYGWSLDDIDEDAKKEIDSNNPVVEARAALERFFTKECSRRPCSGSLADHPRGCGGVNESGECGNYYQVDADGKYKQCYLEGDICQAQTDNTCSI